MTPFILSLIYWLYLSLICQTLVIYDSIGYEHLGREIAHGGLLNLLKDGLQREPVYPLIVASAVRLAETFALDWRWVLKLLHIAILAITQILALIILRGLRVKNPWKTIAIIYIGICPVLVNSTFWIYSEIASLPLILAFVMVAAKSWRDIHGNTSPKIQAFNGIGLGLILALNTLVKAIFEALAPVLIIPFILLAIRGWRTQTAQTTRHAIIVLVCCATSFYVPITSYKYLNKTLNGHFALTDRGPWALYGNTARRMEPLTSTRLAAAFAYIPSPHLCYAVLDQDNCDFWSYKPSDTYGFSKLSEVEGRVPKDQVAATLLKLSIQKAMEHPLQYTFLALLETFKMFFWETTKAGQVTYPDWIETIYKLPWLDPLLVAISALLSLSALVYLMRACWRKRRQLYAPVDSHAAALALFMLLMLVTYAAGHSFFFVLQRYALPLAPLWIIAIAFFLSPKTNGPAIPQQRA